MVVPIFCIEQQKLFSIAWTTEDVASGTELVRPCASKLSLMGLCKKSYWEARFETEEEFDWYCKYAHIRQLLASYLSKTARVLIVGTGTSRLPADMALDGYTDVVAMDYAANVVAKMQTRSKENAWGVRFVEADLTRNEQQRADPDERDVIGDGRGRRGENDPEFRKFLFDRSGHDVLLGCWRVSDE